MSIVKERPPNDEEEIRPEYIEKLKRIRNGKFITIGSIDDFKKRYELE